MDPYLPANVMSSLMQDDKRFNFGWSNRIQDERPDLDHNRSHGGSGSHACHVGSPSNGLFTTEDITDDNKKTNSSNKKETWDELVNVRHFEAFSEELKDSYPRAYPYKHSSNKGLFNNNFNNH